MKEAVHPHPAKPDPPLNLNPPKPSFINANQKSGFGFKSRAPSDIVHDSDVDMEQEGVKSAEDQLADENFNHNNNSESHSHL